MVNKTSKSVKHTEITAEHLLDGLNVDKTMPPIEALKALIFNSNEIRNTKIQFIKEALEAGRYEIHSDHIASKLMGYVAVEETLEFA